MVYSAAIEKIGNPQRSMPADYHHTSNQIKKSNPILEG